MSSPLPALLGISWALPASLRQALGLSNSNSCTGSRSTHMVVAERILIEDKLRVKELCSSTWYNAARGMLMQDAGISRVWVDKVD